MWSDIFTHDSNGEKIAIILLDTQGIFDYESSANEYYTIFALSTIMSSVQCYNLMRNIDSNNLVNLQGFTQISKWALNQSNEIPFQKLLFIVRDFPFSVQFPYGFDDKQRLISKVFKENYKERKQLIDAIKSSFNSIDAFPMPRPGDIVQDMKFTGRIKEIDPKFLRSVDQLVSALFEPDKLVVKKINGKPMLASDFLDYLNKSINALKTLPEDQPKALYEVCLHLDI